ncbi:SlyX protein [gamma proteobacterium HdN1]|nr:SlyX protein [gamma proteobacterium HdN1]
MQNQALEAQTKRTDELEIKVAYLEDALRQLDDEVWRQQRQIEALETLCKKLAQDMQTITDRAGAAGTEPEIPPHY